MRKRIASIGAALALGLAGSAAAQDVDPATFTGARILRYDFPGKLKLTGKGSSFVAHGSGGRKIGKPVLCQLDRESAIALYALLRRAEPVSEKVEGLGSTWSVDFQRRDQPEVFAAISRGSLLGRDPKGWAIFLSGKPALLAPAEQKAVAGIMEDAGCAPREAEGKE